MVISCGYRKRGLDAYGDAVLKRDHVIRWADHDEVADPTNCVFQLGDTIQEVDPDVLEVFVNLTELWVLNPECQFLLSTRDTELLQKNHVLIRGYFSSTAEKLAQKLKLPFQHLDVRLATAGDYHENGSMIIYLRFYPNGSPYINQDFRCQGISAGCDGGGEKDIDLPDDFYMTMSAKDVAEKCWGACYDPLLKNGLLAKLIKTAKQRKGFRIDYSG